MNENWHEKKLMEGRLRLRQQDIEDEPIPTTQDNWQRRWKRRLEQAGYVPFRAVVDYTGNCVYCGEAGRCPGWHIYDGRMDQVAATQAMLQQREAQT